MENKIKKFLYDISVSIASIETYLEGVATFDDYQSNKMLRRAVEREFEIIGEAMSRLDKLAPEINISSKTQIISMRNRVIHGYDKIDDGIIWGTIIKYLPVLKTEVANLID